MLAGVDGLYAVKGKRVVHVDLRKDRPDRAALLGLLLGPTGNLRAPTLRKGRTLLVGFERYSVECISQNEADAALHRHLHDVTSAARTMFEQALARLVIRAGGVVSMRSTVGLAGSAAIT